MNFESREFVEQLLRLMPELMATYEEQIAFWAPDEPPDTTVLGRLGTAIAESFDHLTEDAIVQSFQLVELAVSKPVDDRLGTVVATGLLEGLAAGMRGHLGRWDQVTPFLGPASKHHLENWR
jgi:hypothetical protein